MKKIIFILCLLFSGISYAQYGLQHYSDDAKKDIPVFKVGKEGKNISTKNEFNEGNNDEIVDDFSIGDLFPGRIDIANQGKWQTLENGDKICRIQINSSEGKYMILLFDQFYLPEGTTLYMYSVDGQKIIGPYTHENNVESRKYTLAPIASNSVIVEYYKPRSVQENEELILKSVGLLKDNFSFSSEKQMTKGFGESDRGTPNVRCPEFEEFCDQRRSVALIIKFDENNNRVRHCSGSLINNERSDGTPYFLTASHCVGVSSEDVLQNWLFVFNYESEGCSNPAVEPDMSNTVSGATCLKNSGRTDYALLILNSVPPVEYNVFYNGWSSGNELSFNGFIIHHPRGDIKKISIYNKKVNLNLDNGTLYWKFDCARGSIEGGSSGAPLYNSSGYVAGQISHLGKLNRDNCYAGCFDKSFHDFGLKDILNPKRNSDTPISVMYGINLTKNNWSFSNAHDLHTSENTSYSTRNTRRFNGVYHAANTITTGNNVVIQASTQVAFKAGNEIILNPGFETKDGCRFTMEIENCMVGCTSGGTKSLSLSMDIEPEAEIFVENVSEQIENTLVNDSGLRIYPNPNNGNFQISINEEISSNAQILIHNVEGKLIYERKLMNNEETITIQDSPGIYMIKVINGDSIHTEKIIVR